MMRTKTIRLGFLCVALALCTRMHGQFIGYTAPQTLLMSNTQLFGAATVAAPATSNIFTDIGNTVHFVSYQCASVFKMEVWIEASPTGTAGTYKRISSISYNVATGGLTAYEYQKFVRINIHALQTSAGNCTFAYTGTSTPNQLLQGIFQNTGASLLAWENATANTTYTFTFQPTNARLGGTLWFQYVGGAGTCATLTVSMMAYPTGIVAAFPTPPSTIAIRALPLESYTAGTSVSPALVNTAQIFTLPDMQATDAIVTVVPGAGAGCGGAAALFSMWYSTGPPALGQQVQGPIPSGNSNLANPNKIGCAFNTTPPTVANGSVVDMQCNASGEIIVIPGGGLALSYSHSTAYEASRVIKASPGSLYGVIVYSNNAATQFIQCYNSTTVPADGAVPFLVFAVGATNNGAWVPSSGGLPVAFSVGISCSNSSTADTKTIGVADTIFMATYQ